MSFALEAATKIHSKQVDAAVKTQDLYINLTQKLADTVRTVGDKAVPEALSRRVISVSGPVAKAFGTPTELAAHLTQVTHDWVGIEYRFRTSLLEAVMPSSAPAEGIRLAS